MAPYTSDPGSFPDPVDLSHHLSRSTKARQASSIKQFYKYFSIPGIAQLAGGEFLRRLCPWCFWCADTCLKASPTTSTSLTTPSKQKCHTQTGGNQRQISPSTRLPTTLRARNSTRQTCQRATMNRRRLASSCLMPRVCRIHFV